MKAVGLFGDRSDIPLLLGKIVYHSFKDTELWVFKRRQDLEKVSEVYRNNLFFQRFPSNM